jgi:hypothetical protein
MSLTTGTGTMGDMVSDTFDSRLATLEYLQGVLDDYQETGAYVPDDIVAEYQDATESLVSFAGYWGLEIEQQYVQ